MKYLLIILCFFYSGVGNAIVPTVSVRIGKSLKSILVSGIDLKRHLLFNDDVKKYEIRRITSPEK